MHLHAGVTDGVFIPAADLKRRAIEVFSEVSYSPKKEPVMTYQEESAVLEAVTTILIEHGADGRSPCRSRRPSEAASAVAG